MQVKQALEQKLQLFGAVPIKYYPFKQERQSLIKDPEQVKQVL